MNLGRPIPRIDKALLEMTCPSVNSAAVIVGAMPEPGQGGILTSIVAFPAVRLHGLTDLVHAGRQSMRSDDPQNGG